MSARNGGERSVSAVTCRRWPSHMSRKGRGSVSAPSERQPSAIPRAQSASAGGAGAAAGSGGTSVRLGAGTLHQPRRLLDPPLEVAELALGLLLLEVEQLAPQLLDELAVVVTRLGLGQVER